MRRVIRSLDQLPCIASKGSCDAKSSQWSPVAWLEDVHDVPDLEGKLFGGIQNGPDVDPEGVDAD